MNTMQLIDMTLESDPGLPAFFLGRLASMVARQIATVSPTERHALGEAIFSVYLDCLDLGLGKEAQVLVEQLRDGAMPGEPLAA